MALIVILALMGLLGLGPLSTATAGYPNGSLWVEYNRFDRAASPTFLKVHARTNSDSPGQVRFWVDRAFMEMVELQKVTPEPERVEAGVDRLTYVLNASRAPGQDVAVMFVYEYRCFGRRPVRIGLEHRPELSFNQFIYP